MPGLLERLRGPGMFGAVGPIGASARNLFVRCLGLLQTIVLCLSVPIRGYDDPNFDIPSATLSLHLQSCAIVSASLWGFGQALHAPDKNSSRTANKSQDGCMEQLQNFDRLPMSVLGAALLRFSLLV